MGVPSCLVITNCDRELSTHHQRDPSSLGNAQGALQTARLNTLLQATENARSVEELRELKRMVHELCRSPASSWQHPTQQGRCWDLFARICASLGDNREAAVAVELSIHVLLKHAYVSFPFVSLFISMLFYFFASLTIFSSAGVKLRGRVTQRTFRRKRGNCKRIRKGCAGENDSTAKQNDHRVHMSYG